MRERVPRAATGAKTENHLGASQKEKRPGRPGRFLLDGSNAVRAYRRAYRSGNCFAMAAASGSAIICMCPAPERAAVQALTRSFAAWASITCLAECRGSFGAPWLVAPCAKLAVPGRNR